MHKYADIDISHTCILSGIEHNSTSENAEQTPPQLFLEHFLSLLLEIILPSRSLIQQKNILEGAFATHDVAEAIVSAWFGHP